MNWHKKAEDAVESLTNSDDEIAELRLQYEINKRAAKRIWSAIFMRQVDGSVELKKAIAETDKDYVNAQTAELHALLEYEKLRNRRDTAQIVIDFWRSWNKAKTEGQI